MKTMPTINFIGAGRVGKTLAYLSYHHELGHIRGILNKDISSSKNAIQFIGSGSACSRFEDLERTDIYIITTPDSQIQNVAFNLSQKHHFKPGSLVIHCSGSLTSEVLASVQNQGCIVGSLHPTSTFADPEQSIKNFTGTLCGYEGSDEGYTILAPMIEKMGGKIFRIEKEYKTLYHVAGVFSTNYLVGLYQGAQLCLQKAQVADDLIPTIIHSYMQTALCNLLNHSPNNALTGPIQRADLNTIQRNITALADLAKAAKQLPEHPAEHPELLAVYQALGLLVLDLTPHSKAIKEEIRALLRG